METQDSMEEIIMKLIVESGEAKSAAFEAIHAARKGEFKQAEERLKFAGTHLMEAHHRQTALIQQEATGERHEVSLLMVHAQDHLMTAMVVRDLAQEFLALYRKGEEKEA